MSENEITVLFHPGERKVHIREGMTFVEAAARAGFPINTPCGGSGKCGKCRVRFEHNAPVPCASETTSISYADIEAGWRLACQTPLLQDAVVHIPQSSIFGGHHQIQTDSDSDKQRTVDGEVRMVNLEMPAPNMTDDMPDLMRMEKALAETLPDWNAGEKTLTALPAVLRRLGRRLRELNFKGTAVLLGDQLIDFTSVEDAKPLYALAFDIGTTTLAGALLDSTTGEEKGVVSAMNPQTAYGDDVLSRIAYAGRDDAALEELQQCVMDAVRDMTQRLCAGATITPQQICSASFTGNTTMQHLLCGFDPVSLGTVPFVPLHKRGISMKASEIGLELHPHAFVYIFPVIGGFVGGDTVAGLLSCEMAHKESPVVMVDIGTNGEIVLLHDGELCAASTAAGPAFEGARISCGMRAANGAIERVKAGEDLEFSVIGGCAPTGLCGSGLIDLCGELLKVGALLCDGRMPVGEEADPSVPQKIRQRLRLGADGEPECVLYESEGHSVTLTQRDVRELQLGAGAIRAGIQILLKQAGISSKELKQVLIAGGFGSFIRRDNAQRIGLIPADVPHEQVRFAGNVAFSGAKWVALSRSARLQAEALAQSVRHVELNQDPDFAMEFAMAMQFPGE